MQNFTKTDIVHWLRFRTPRWSRGHWTTEHWGKGQVISKANFDLIWFWFLRSFYIVHWLSFRIPRWPRGHWKTGHWGISSFVHHTSCVRIYTWQPVFLGFSQFTFKLGNFFQQNGIFTKFPEIFLLMIFMFFLHCALVKLQNP